MTLSDPEELVTLQLGQLIFDHEPQSPTGFSGIELAPVKQASPSEPPDPNAVTISGPAASYSQANLVPGEVLRDLRQRPQASLFWAFGGRQFQVIKALRIPYRYERPDGSNDIAYLLVGFELGGESETDVRSGKPPGR